MSLAPGATIGRYQILEPLGQGGMASVYKAFHPTLDRVVALKVLRPDLAQEPQFLERFDREAKAIARLRHPHIVEVFDYDFDRGHPFIVMEFVEAGTLKAKLGELHGRGEHLPPHEAARVVAEVASALSFAHQHGVVHRDIKPSNILLTRAGKAVVTDFGIARVLAATSHTQTGVGIGTPEYMSPEQGQGRSVDHRSDVYSLGVVAYELLAGSVPFTADTPLAVIYAHVYDPLPLPSTRNPAIGPRTEQALLKALAKDPAARFVRAVDLADALRSAVEAPANLTAATIAVPESVRPAAAEPTGPVAVRPIDAFLAATGALVEAPAGQAAVAAGVLVALGGFVTLPLAVSATLASESIGLGDARLALDLIVPALSSLALVPVVVALHKRVGPARPLTAVAALALASLFVLIAWRIALGPSYPRYSLFSDDRPERPVGLIALYESSNVFGDPGYGALRTAYVPPYPLDLLTLHNAVVPASLALAVWLMAANAAGLARRRLRAWVGALGATAGALLTLSILLDVLPILSILLGMLPGSSDPPYALLAVHVPGTLALSLWAIGLGEELSAFTARPLVALSAGVVASGAAYVAFLFTALDAAVFVGTGALIVVAYIAVLAMATTRARARAL